MAEIITIKCPHCKKRKKAERKSMYFQNMGCLIAIFHFFMLLLTGFIWVGWLIGSYIYHGKENLCLTCKKKVADQHII